MKHFQPQANQRHKTHLYFTSHVSESKLWWSLFHIIDSFIMQKDNWVQGAYSGYKLPRLFFFFSILSCFLSSNSRDFFPVTIILFELDTTMILMPDKQCITDGWVIVILFYYSVARYNTTADMFSLTSTMQDNKYLYYTYYNHSIHRIL